MRYLALLGRDESDVPRPGTPERAEMHAGYVRFAELAADAILAGEALQPRTTARTVRARRRRRAAGDRRARTPRPPRPSAGSTCSRPTRSTTPSSWPAEIPAAPTGGSSVRPLVDVGVRHRRRRPRAPAATWPSSTARSRPATSPAPRSGTRGRPSTAASPRRPGRRSWPAGALHPVATADHRAGARRRAAGDRRPVQPSRPRWSAGSTCSRRRDVGRGGGRGGARSPSTPAGRSRCDPVADMGDDVRPPAR